MLTQSDEAIADAAPVQASEAITDEALNEGLAIVSIAKSYDKKVVLSDVSLSVAKGEVVGLLGPNGAGKTTCFYSIMGLVKPDSGRIMLEGEDITPLPMYRRAMLGLGYLPQETSIFRGLSVEANIAAVLELSEPNRAARAQRLEELLDEFGLTRLRSSAAMALSGGERRRCEIARALAASPSIMLLDEPFGALDAITRRQMHQWLQEVLARDRRTVLLVTHDVEEALVLSDEVYVMTPRPGHIAAKVDAPFERPRRPEIVTSAGFVARKAELLAALDGLSTAEARTEPSR